MSKSHLHISHHEAIRIALAMLAAVIFMEAAALLKYLTHGDVLTGTLIVTGWFKDGLHAVMERLTTGI